MKKGKKVFSKMEEIMKKKLLKLLAIFCISLVCFMACEDMGGNGGFHLPEDFPLPEDLTDEAIKEMLGELPEPVVPSVPETDEKIVLTVWESTDGPDEFIRQAGEAFSEKYPNVEIKFVNVESKDAVNQMVLDGPAGVGADLFAAQHDQLSKVYKNNIGLPVTLSSEVEKSLLDSGRQATTLGGISLGYPVSAETYALYYNKDLISEDEVPTTWEELIDWTKKFNKNNPGKQGFMMDVGNAYYSILFTTANGNRLFGKSGLNFMSSFLNTENAYKGMKTFQALSKVINLPARDLTGGICDAAFTSGNAAMVISGQWNLRPYKNAGINYGVTTLPALPGDATPAASFVGVRCMFVSAYSKHPETAAAFAEFLLTEEMQALRYELTNGALPSIKMELEDENANGFVKQLDYAFPMRVGPYMDKYWEVFGATSANIWNGADIKTELD
jgi:arabinogalactan oligomer/maltooligosaccharide transport system substrate-binding protein